MEPDTLMIQTLNMTKRYGKVVALNNVALEVAEGESCALLGRTGAGKTTCLRILSTLLQVTWGEARIAGFVAGFQSPKIRPLIGYVPDHLTAATNTTPQEELEFFATAHRIYGARRHRAVEEMLSLADLVTCRHDDLTQLPDGVRQRLAIARASVHNPRLLLLDEPIAGLDQPDRCAVRELLLRVKERGATLFFAAHALRELADICTSIAVLDKGDLRFTGNLDELYTKTEARPIVEIGVSDDADATFAVLQDLPGVLGLRRLSSDEASMVKGLVPHGMCFEYDDSTEQRLDGLPKLLVDGGAKLIHFSVRLPDVESAVNRLCAGNWAS